MVYNNDFKCLLLLWKAKRAKLLWKLWNFVNFDPSLQSVHNCPQTGQSQVNQARLENFHFMAGGNLNIVEYRQVGLDAICNELDECYVGWGNND